MGRIPVLEATKLNPGVLAAIRQGPSGTALRVCGALLTEGGGGHALSAKMVIDGSCLFSYPLGDHGNLMCWHEIGGSVHAVKATVKGKEGYGHGNIIYHSESVHGTTLSGMMVACKPLMVAWITTDPSHCVLALAATSTDAVNAVTRVALSLLKLNEVYLRDRFGVKFRPNSLKIDVNMDIPSVWSDLSGTSCGAGIVGEWVNR